MIWPSARLAAWKAAAAKTPVFVPRTKFTRSLSTGCKSDGEPRRDSWSLVAFYLAQHFFSERIVSIERFQAVPDLFRFLTFTLIAPLPRLPQRASNRIIRFAGGRLFAQRLQPFLGELNPATLGFHVVEAPNHVSPDL